MPFDINNKNAPNSPMDNDKARELLDAIKQLTDTTRESSYTISDAARSMASSVSSATSAGGSPPSGVGASTSTSAPPSDRPPPPPSGPGVASGSPGGSGPGGMSIPAAAGVAATAMGALGDAAKTGMKDSLDWLNSWKENIARGASVITQEVIGVRKKIDEGRVAFNRAAGISDMAGSLRGLVGTLHGLGESYGTAGAHVGSLVKAMPGLLDMSASAQHLLGKQSVILQRLGVDAQTYGNAVNIMQRSLAMTPEAIYEANTALYGLGRSLKIPPDVMMKDFAEAMPKLVGFGKAAPDIFAKAEKYAKALGISMATITKQIDNFGTFEDAAEKAGNLNVIMRQNLFDTNELLYASPTEKVKIFTDALDKYKQTTGKSFDQMDIFMQKAIAEQSGFTIEELTNMSKHTTKELDKFDDIKMKDFGGDKTAAQMKSNAKATVSYAHSLEMLHDRMVMAFSGMAGNGAATFARLTNSMMQMQSKIQELKKTAPELAEVLQQAMDEGAARGFASATGTGGVIDGGLDILIGQFGKGLYGQVKTQVLTLLGSKDKAEREFAKNLGIGAMGPQIDELMRKGLMTDDIMKEYFSAAIGKFQELRKKGEDYTNETKEQLLQEIVWNKKQQDMYENTDKSLAARMQKSGASAVPQSFAARQQQQQAPSVPNQAQAKAPSADMLSASFSWVKDTFSSLPEQIKQAGDVNKNEGIKASINQVSENLTQNVADSFKAKFEEKTSVIEESIRGPVTAAITSAFSSLQPGSADDLATSNLSAIITGMQSINTVQINPENNKQIEKLIKNIKDINKTPVATAFIESINKLTESLTKLIPQLTALEGKKDILAQTFAEDKVNLVNLQTLVSTLDKYVEAVEKAKAASSTGMEPVLAVLKEVAAASAAAVTAAGIDYKMLGDAMSGPIAKAIKDLST